MIMHQNKKVTLYCKVCTGGEDEERRMRSGGLRSGGLRRGGWGGRIRREGEEGGMREG